MVHYSVVEVDKREIIIANELKQDDQSDATSSSGTQLKLLIVVSVSIVSGKRFCERKQTHLFPHYHTKD